MTVILNNQAHTTVPHCASFQTFMGVRSMVQLTLSRSIVLM